MKRHQLEHILRAAGAISGCRDIVVIGSQAILGSFPDAPEELLSSIDADVYPLNEPGKAELIQGCIGELSPFHETFGYYAHGVGPETAVLPSGWKSRLVRVETPATEGTIGWCLSAADLAVSKLLAGRETDFAFVRTLLRTGLLSQTDVQQVMAELTPEQARTVQGRMALLR